MKIASFMSIIFVLFTTAQAFAAKVVRNSDSPHSIFTSVDIELGREKCSTDSNYGPHSSCGPGSSTNCKTDVWGKQTCTTSNYSSCKYSYKTCKWEYTHTETVKVEIQMDPRAVLQADQTEKLEVEIEDWKNGIVTIELSIKSKHYKYSYQEETQAKSGEVVRIPVTMIKPRN